MKSAIRFFSSVKLAIVLLIIITLASTLGTLIPQQRSVAEYAARYGQISALLVKLEITNLYHSWWYIALLLMFALNLLVCTLTRLSPKLRRVFRPRIASERKSLLSLKLHERLKKDWAVEQATQELKRYLGRHRYRVRTQKAEDRSFLLGQKRLLGHFGSDIVHLGLLIILAGGIISGIGGFRTSLNISEGQTLPVPGADFEIRLDRFETEYYPSGGVKDWKSTLTVIEDNVSVLTKTIEVNHPLSHRGFMFYQSSYGWDWDNPRLEIWAKKTTDPSFQKKISLRLGQRMPLDDGGLEISALHFVPDFVITEKNEVATRSLDPNNPAAYIEGWKGKEKVFAGWIFAKFPDFSRIHSSMETDLNFELKDFEASQYSGIQVSRDPGVNLIWAGCIVLMIGLLVAFFWPPNEIRMVLQEERGRTDVTAGGVATKNKEGFAAEFHRIMTTVRRMK
ncbi:MAG: cytochrome c biogenesis protein ResB [Candidatus Aminicenantales bacterium]